MRAKYIYFLAVISCLASCSEVTTEEKDFTPTAQSALQNVIFLADPQTQQTISAFRKGDSGFAFLKTIPVTGSQAKAQLPVGDYQFLFAGSYGTYTHLNTPTPGITLFPEMRFTVVPDEENPGYIRQGDELFLQAGKVDSIYTIEKPSTIRATVYRAVSQVIICIKRGWTDGSDNYTPLPYANDTITRYFSNVQVEIGNAGTSVDTYGTPRGQGKLVADFTAHSPDSITPEGFAVYKGPFFFPAANGEPVHITLNLFRRNDSPQPDLHLSKQATVMRNSQLIINAWVTSDWNFIGVTADIRPISRETEGEQNIWDDYTIF